MSEHKNEIISKFKRTFEPFVVAEFSFGDIELFIEKWSKNRGDACRCSVDVVLKKNKNKSSSSYFCQRKLNCCLYADDTLFLLRAVRPPKSKVVCQPWELCWAPLICLPVHCWQFLIRFLFCTTLPGEETRVCTSQLMICDQYAW